MPNNDHEGGIPVESLMVNIDDDQQDGLDFSSDQLSALNSPPQAPPAVRSVRAALKHSPTPTMVPIAPKHARLDVSVSAESELASLDSSVNSVASAQLGGEIDPEDFKNRDPNMNYYSCNQCNKYFWTENSMRHHFSMYHSEKAFVCEICGKAFRFRSNLAEHRSVHTSLKPYVCKYCGKSSRLKGNLTKHILKHHKVETNAVVGKEDIIIKKGKKSVKDPKCIDFLQKSMIVLTAPPESPELVRGSPASNASSASSALAAFASHRGTDSPVPLRGRGQYAKHTLPSQFDTADTSIQNSVNAIIESALGAATGFGNESLPVEKSSDPEMRGNHAASDTSTPGFPESPSLEDCFGHEALHSMSKTQCPLCNKHFRKASQLDHHLRSYHGSVSLNGVKAEPANSSAGAAETKPTASPLAAKPAASAAIVSLAPARSSPNVDHNGIATSTLADTNGHQNGGLRSSPLFGGNGQALRSPDPFFCFSQKLNNLAGCQRDIQEIKELLAALKSSYLTANASKNGFSTVQPKIESLLTSLDNRVSRVERQMEASLSTLGTLIQVQTSMNLAMSQFRMEIMAKVAALADQLKPIATLPGSPE